MILMYWQRIEMKLLDAVRVGKAQNSVRARGFS